MTLNLITRSCNLMRNLKFCKLVLVPGVCVISTIFCGTGQNANFQGIWDHSWSPVIHGQTQTYSKGL